MNGDETELELEIPSFEDETQAEPLATSPTPPLEAAAGPTLEERFAALQAEHNELKSKPAPAPTFDAQAIAQAIREAAGGGQRQGTQPTHSPEQLQAMNQQVFEAFAQDPVGTMRQMTEPIVQSRIDALMRDSGVNVLGTAGEQVITSYIAGRQNEAEGGPKLNAAIAAEFVKSITQEQRAGLASANPQQRKQFMDAQYKMAAGEVLLASRKKGSPRDLGTGGTGGAGRQLGGLVEFPGLDARTTRQLNALAAKNPKMTRQQLQKIADDIARGA